MSQQTNHEGACHYGGKVVRETHEWYLDDGGKYCRQCGARQKNGSWLCVSCRAPLVRVKNCVIDDASKLLCHACQEKAVAAWFADRRIVMTETRLPTANPARDPGVKGDL